MEAEKEALERIVKLQGKQLDVEELKRKVLEEDMDWLLQKCIVRIVDRVVESVEFSLRVRWMKAAFMAADMEGGK